MAGTFKGVSRPLKLQAVPHREGTVVRFGDTSQTCILESEIIATFADTGHPCFIRLKFGWPKTESDVSRDYQFVFLTWKGGATVGHIKDAPWKECTTRVHISATKLNAPFVAHGLQHPFRVDVFVDGTDISNLRERFYFPSVPLEVASLQDKKQVEWLADLVGDLLHREREQFAATAQAQQREQLQNFPSHNPAKDYPKPDFDHYANQREVLLKLLRKKWPHLSKAATDFGNAKTSQEKADKQTAVWLGYIADYKTLFKKLPNANKTDFADLIQNEKWHDYYIRLMSDAINVVPQEDKRDWQLAIGWIEKNYYRMSEAQLESAFSRDWNYKPGVNKGHALATRAHRLGLVSFLIPGPKK